MTIKISEFDDSVRIAGDDGDPIYLSHTEQAELLEALARAHGYTLIDREERKSLTALVEEVDEDENDYDNPVQAWTAWQKRAEALAAAVQQSIEEV